MSEGQTVSPNLLQTDHYDFELPKELIAQEPLENREDARLMTIDRTTNQLDHYHVRDLDERLNPGDCLVLNDTKVIPAKLVGHRTSTRGRWQGLVIESDEDGNLKLMAKTRGSIQAGETVTLEDRQGKPVCRLLLIARQDRYWIAKPLLQDFPEDQFYIDSKLIELSTPDLLDIVGRVPLPHYIRGGNMVDADSKNYQTIFAKQRGAIAAPTAGLHFTNGLFQRIIDRGISIASVTLHVGMGTFRPVETDDLTQHQMHSEYGSITQKAVDTINETKARGGRVISVGTTSTRVLESAGADGNLAQWSGETDLFIRPGYQFKVIDGLMTNFHLPKSSLIVLVRTFGGDELMKRAYLEAIEEEYRFFSYGDTMLIV